MPFSFENPRTNELVNSGQRLEHEANKRSEEELETEAASRLERALDNYLPVILQGFDRLHEEADPDPVTQEIYDEEARNAGIFYNRKVTSLSNDLKEIIEAVHSGSVDHEELRQSVAAWLTAHPREAAVLEEKTPEGVNPSTLVIPLQNGEQTSEILLGTIRRMDPMSAKEALLEAHAYVAKELRRLTSKEWDKRIKWGQMGGHLMHGRLEQQPKYAPAYGTQQDLWDIAMFISHELPWEDIKRTQDNNEPLSEAAIEALDEASSYLDHFDISGYKMLGIDINDKRPKTTRSFPFFGRKE